MEIKTEAVRTNFYQEAGRIHGVLQRLKQLRVDAVFEPGGIRLSEVGGASIRSEYFHTSGELQAYLWGLEDGANAVEKHPILKNQKD